MHFAIIYLSFVLPLYQNHPQVHPVELSAVSDVKQRYATECGALLASSPMVSLDLRGRVLNKPLLVSVPVPPPPTKAKRPVTAAPDTRTGKARKGLPSRGASRPVSAFGLGVPKKEGMLLQHSRPRIDCTLSGVRFARAI